MESNKEFILGVYNDDEILLEAVKKITGNKIRIHEVFSPYPLHGIDELLGYKRSRLPKVAFIFGVVGFLSAVLLQFWTMGVDWPMIIGGKNFTSIPPFVPIMFELTVLISALGMVGTFMVASDLKPYKKPRIFDPRITDDKLVIAIDVGENPLPKKDISELVKKTGAEEINEKIFE